MLSYLFIAFIAIVSIQCIYYVVVFGSVAFSKHSLNKKQFNKPVSIIICAKNEAKNLKENLPLFLTQNYPQFELVLINDRSRDKTLEVLEKFKATTAIPIKIVDVKENEQFWGSKKYALTLGIKAATHEHLLFTDADCIPSSTEWIAQMTQQFNSTDIVIGYGAYQKIKGSFLNKLIRFETLFTAIQYFSFAKLGKPYMGVGRNLAYTKTVFFNLNGFADHMKIKSGDDDLFINQAAKKNAISSCYTQESFTISTPKQTFNEWILQKRRHVSTAKHYRFIHKFLLGLFYSSQLFFWITAIILLAFLFNWIVVVSCIGARIIIQYLVIGFSAKKFNEKDLIFFAPFFELFLIFIQLFIFIKNSFSKPAHW